MRGVKRLLIGSFLALLSSLAYGQAGFGQADPPLNFGNNYFVTGDYVVAGAYGLNIVGGSGFATGTINIPDTNNKGLTGANQVPAGAQIVKALLYWQTVEKVGVVPGQPESGQNGFFLPVDQNGKPFAGGPQTGYAMSGVSVTNSSTVSWSSGGCTGSSTGKLLRTYRADVTDFLPQDPSGNAIANGTVTVNNKQIQYGTYQVRLPSTGNNTPLTLGATLVIIFRVLSPDYPLNSIVIYDGDFSPGNASLTMTQTVQGFYDAAYNRVSRLTHIVSNGKSNKNQTVYLNGQALPFLYGGLSAFPGHYVDWDTVTWTFDDPKTNPVHEDDSSATTEVIPASSNQGCVAWGAVIVSTTVKNSDGDGLLDVWKQPKAPNNPSRPGYCDASVNEGVCTQGDANWVDLPGATKGKKDVFVQLDYMCSSVTGGDSCDTSGANYSFDPRLTVDAATGKSAVQKVIDAYAAKGIHLHVNPPTPNAIQPVHAIPEQTCADNLNTVPPQLCIFPNQPGVVAWKGDLLFFKNQLVDPDDPTNLNDCTTSPPAADCISRFQSAQKDSYHYSLWAHTLGLPNWTLLGGSLATAVQAGQMVTFTTSIPHGLIVDQNAGNGRVTVAYAITNPSLNGTYLVHSVLNANTFTILVSNSTNATYTFSTDPNFAVVSGNALESGTISGFSDIGGADSLITLGSWGADGQTWQIKASTFMHELGHSNGLTHGGFYFDSLPANNKDYTATIEGNCKSNFQSVMNYEFQLALLDTGTVDQNGTPVVTVDYSEQGLNQGANTLDEGTATAAGIFSNAFYPTTSWYIPTTVGTPRKDHCDGTPKLANERMSQFNGPATSLSWSAGQDINFDGVIETVLRPHNDWADTTTNGLVTAPGINLEQVSAAGSMSSSGAKGFGGGGGAKGFGGGGGAKGFGGGGGAHGFGGGGGAHGFGGGGGAGELNVETANAQTFPPRNLRASSEGASPRVITLNWAAPAFGQIGAYRVYRAVRGATPPFPLLATVPGTQLTYQDQPVCNANGYQYYVTAVLAGTFPTFPPGPTEGQESINSNIVSSIPPASDKLTGCYIVTGPGVAASAIQGSAVPITWTLVDDFYSPNNPVTNKAANTLVAIGPISNDTNCGPITNSTPRTVLLSNGIAQGNGTKNYGTFVGNGAGGFTYTLDSSLFNAGCYFFQLNLDSGQSAQSTALQLLIFVSDNGPYVTTTSPLVPDGVVGSAYTTALDEAGGVPPVTWNIVPCAACSPGAPPPGVSLSASGTLSGTPTAPGIYTFQVNVTDSAGNIGTPQTLTLRVADALFGDLIVADGGPSQTPSGTLLRVTQSGTTTGTIAAISSGQPTGVAVDANTGNLYAAVAPVSGSGTPGVVQVVGPYGAVANPFGPVGVLQNPVAVTVDSSGNVYVGDNKANAIYEFNSSGTQVGAGAFAPLPSSGGVANHLRMTFDSTGNLIVASDNVGGTFGIVEVDKFDSSANKTVLYNTTTNAGLTDPLTAVNASATITSFAITSNVVTLQAANSFTAGTNVQISGLSVGTYLNGQALTVISSGLSGTQFEVNFTNPDVASTADTGTARAQAATYVGTFSPPLPGGSSVTISGFTNPGNNGTFIVQSGSTSSQLVVNNPNGVTETNPGTATFGIATVGGVATFPDGSIDIADSSMQTIYKITTTPSLAVAPDLSTTNALCCNISGMTNPSGGTTLFVTLDQAAKMQKAVPPSTITNILSGAPLTFPNDVATYSKH